MSEPPEAGQVPVTSPRASMREIERRRSERLLLTVPIQVEGVNRWGEKFSEATRTIVINRQGARIFLKEPVAAGAVVLVSNNMGHRKAKFRVVGPTQPATAEGGEWGLECLDEKANLWGIGFPPPQQELGSCTALIECRRCHALKLSALSMVELEVLGTSGLLVKECEPCGRSTPWSYRDPAHGTPYEDPDTNAEVLEAHKSTGNRRFHSRVALQLPIHTAHQILKQRNQTGNLWMSESFDRIVRTENDLSEKAEYILQNAVKKQLVENGREYDGYWDLTMA